MRKRTAILLCAVLGAGMMLALTACGSGKTGDGAVSGVESSKTEDGAASGVESSKTEDGAASGTESSEAGGGASSNKGAPVSLADAKQPKDKDFIYDKFNTWVELHGYQGKDEVIVIPTTIEGLPVTMDGFVISEKAKVRGIVLEEGYTSIPRIACESDENSPIEAIKLPSTCTEQVNTNPFTSLPYLKTIEVAEGNTVFFVEDDVLYADYGEEYNKVLVCYPPMKEGETLVLPDDVSLAEGCFIGNSMLKRVENAVPWSGGNIIAGTSIEEVVCGDRWKHLDQHQFEDFSGESKLRSITLSVNLNDLVWKVDHFAGLDSLEEIVVPEGNSTFFSEDGVLYYIGGKKQTYLLKYPNARPGEDFTVSEKADMLYYMSTVFENPIYLKRVHIPSKWESDRGSIASDMPNGIEVVVD